MAIKVKHHFLLISEDTLSVAPPPLPSLFSSLLGSLSVVFLSLPKPLLIPPPPLFPPCLPLGSLPTVSFYPLPVSLLTSYLIFFLLLYLPLFQSFTPLPILALLPFFTSFPSFPLSISPSCLAFPQQQQMRFPFTEPPFPASLHLFLPPSLAPSLSHSMHSSLLPLRALFCLNQELKCCILIQTMPAIQSGPV